jgi:hypothetical protein
MARHLFGLSPADFAVERVGDETKLRPGAIGTVWDSYSGGSQLTDLLAIDTTPVNVVTATADATVGFYGPDGVSLVYVDFAYGLRFALTAIDLGPALDTKVPLAGGTMTGDLTVSANLNVSGLSTLTGALSAPAAGFSGLVTASAGLTVSAGTTAVQALTATSVAATGASTAASYAATGDVSGATATAVTVRGSAAGSGSNLTLTSTGNATKGKVLLGSAGTSAFDETNQRLGIRTASPSNSIHIIDPQSSSTASAILLEGATTTAASRRVLSVRVNADTWDRFWIDYDGRLSWGPGNTSGSTASISSDGVSGIQVNGDLAVTGDITQAAQGVGSTVFARKTATTTYTSTTTLANDPHLFTPTLVANSVWMCFFGVGYTTSAANTGALKLQLTGPTGWSELLRAVDATGADTYQFNVATGDQWGSLAGVIHNAFYAGIIRIGSTAGVVRIQGAQWTSSATSTVTQIDSYMYMRRVA